MSQTSPQWLLALRKLLPRGCLWMLPEGGQLESLLLAIGDGLIAAEGDIENILVEANPSTTSALLPDWNATCGLPDGCLPGGGSTAQQRQAIVGKLNEGAGVSELGSASEQYYIGVAASYGFTVTIDAPAPFTWRVTSSLAANLVNSTCDCTCDDPLEAFGSTQLECVMSRLNQAHTKVEFAYTG